MFKPYEKTADNGSGDDWHSGGTAAAAVIQPAVVHTVLKAPANTSAIDISNIAGVHRTKNGKTPNDFTVENPMDLYAVQRIFDTLVENTARTTPAGQKITYIIGENHGMPAQKLAQPCLNTAIIRVHGPSSHVFCYEKEYNSLERIAQEVFGLTVPDNLRGRLHEDDPHGRLLLQGMVSFASSPQAPESTKIVLTHALKHDIPVMFTDAGKVDGGGRIDPADPVARNVAMQMYKVDLTKERLYTAPGYSPDKKDARGFDVRNGAMVKRALDFAETHGADVIVQQCGRAHTFGKKQYHTPFKNSLSPLFAAQGCSVVPIFFNIEADGHTAEAIVPDAAWAQFPDAVILRGVSQRAFQRELFFSNLDDGLPYTRTLTQEYRRKAGVPAPFDVKLYTVHVQTYKNDLKKLIRTAKLELNQ